MQSVSLCLCGTWCACSALDQSVETRARLLIANSTLSIRQDTVISLGHARMTTPSQDRETNKLPSKKLRSACDICHQAKMKCSGGTPCQGCRSSDHECIYSVSKRIGRPKGTKNKRTADRVSRQKSEKERKSHKSERGCQVPGSPPAPGQISGARPQTLIIDHGPSQRHTTMGNRSIDALLGSASNPSYSLPESEVRSQFANNMDPWYDFGNLAETSPLKVSIAWYYFIVWL